MMRRSIANCTAGRVKHSLFAFVSNDKHADMALRSVDLFTGLGGFVLGLSHVYEPALYCDSSVVVRENLARLMAQGRIPSADVIHDVRNTADICQAVGGRVDLITAGFPCVGFSLRGRREGLADERSALVRSVIDLTERLRPGLVMLENVPTILSLHNGDNMRAVVEEFSAVGYDCRWTTVSASDVGLPQRRTRWFCLCVSREGDPLAAVRKSLDSAAASGRQSVAAPALTVPDAPGPLLVPRGDTYSARYFMLGNAVIPAAVRHAFTSLCAMDTTSMRQRHSGVPIERMCKCRSYGHTHKGTAFSGPTCPHTRTTSVAGYEVVLCPEHYKHTYVKRDIVRSPPIVGRRVIKNWPTPRATAPRHSHVLSNRTLGDLPTVALFACSIQGLAQPPSGKGMVINPAFVEWLMGFPPGWTDIILPRRMTLAQIESRAPMPEDFFAPAKVLSESEDHT